MGKRIQLDIVYRPKKGAQRAPLQTAADVIKSAVDSVDCVYPEKRASEYAEAFNSPTESAKASGRSQVERLSAHNGNTASSNLAAPTKPKTPRKSKKKGPAKLAAKKRGRPSTNFDRKAYMRIYVAADRWAKKANVSIEDWLGMSVSEFIVKHPGVSVAQFRSMREKK